MSKQDNSFTSVENLHNNSKIRVDQTLTQNENQNSNNLSSFDDTEPNPFDAE